MNYNTNSCRDDIVNRALSLLRENGIVDFDIDPTTDTEKLVSLWYNTALNNCIMDVKPPFAIRRQKLLKEKDVYADSLEEYKEEKTQEESNDKDNNDKDNNEEENNKNTIPATPLTPATPSGDSVPMIPLIPATPIKETNNRINDCEYINNNKFHLLSAFRIPGDCLQIMLNDNNHNNYYIMEGNYIYINTNENYFILRYLATTNELYEREVKFNLCLSYYIAYYICVHLTNNDNKLSVMEQLKDKILADTRTFYLKERNIRFNKEYRWKK